MRLPLVWRNFAAAFGRRHFERAVTKAAYTHVGPGLPPLHGQRAGALILGSFPSPKSREQGFFYGHPQNRFWPLMATLTHSPTPAWEDLDAKRAIIIGSGLAVWDVIHACEREGSLDSRIHAEVVNPIDALTEAYPLIHTVICNGKKSETLYQRHFAHLPLKQIYLPSTSNANRTIKEEALFACWIDTLRCVLEQ